MHLQIYVLFLITWYHTVFPRSLNIPFSILHIIFFSYIDICIFLLVFFCFFLSPHLLSLSCLPSFLSFFFFFTFFDVLSYPIIYVSKFIHFSLCIHLFPKVLLVFHCKMSAILVLILFSPKLNYQSILLFYLYFSFCLFCIYCFKTKSSICIFSALKFIAYIYKFIDI